jgi:AcrR family transcriptional regulator
MQKPRTRQPTETRQAEIIEAALDLAARGSPADITTAEIASELNLSQGAVFKHFPTKGAI